MCPRPEEFAHFSEKCYCPGVSTGGGEAWAPLELSDALHRRGGQIFKIVASRFVDVSGEEINLMKENAIPRNTKHATKFGMTRALFKGKM